MHTYVISLCMLTYQRLFSTPFLHVLNAHHMTRLYFHIYRVGQKTRTILKVYDSCI